MSGNVTKSGDRRYIQLLEDYRDNNGRPRHRTIATLGRADQIAGELDSVINGLLHVSGRSALDDDGPSVEFDSARTFGDVWILNELWKQLGFDALRLPLHGRRLTLRFSRHCPGSRAFEYVYRRLATE